MIKDNHPIREDDDDDDDDDEDIYPPCTCKASCPRDCKGECGCVRCKMEYSDFLAEDQS